MQPMRVFLDMDGVLADFVGGVHRVHGRPNCYDNPSNLGRFDIEACWGVSAEEFWEPTDTFEFWNGLDKMPDADAFVDFVCGEFLTSNVAVLTAPSKACACFTGKRAWIERYYPQFKRRIIYGTAKDFLAGPNRILIDDRDRNVEEFAEHGGIGILVPRPWNSAYHVTIEPLAAVKQALLALQD